MHTYTTSYGFTYVNCEFRVKVLQKLDPTFYFLPATSHRAISAELRVFLAILETGSRLVFGREDWLDANFERPVDGEIGIVPA